MPARAALREHRAADVRGRAHPALDRLFAFALVLLLALLMPAHSQAQSSGVPPDLEAQSAEYLPQDQLDALLAPIALYPDDLLAQVLMASTYPLEVVEAARFVQQNPALSGAALDDAVRTRRWDPSVQSLTAFPQVLAMMSDRLEWTQQLGDAVLANRQQVMDTVQALRTRAEATGTLQDTDQQHVYTSDQGIIIEPAQFDYVYVPVYDPLVAYGPWWVASYQPFFWYPPAYFGYPVHWHGVGIVWGRAVPGRSKPLGLGSSGMAGGQDRRDDRPQRILQPPAIPQLPRQRFVAARARAPAWRRLWKRAGARSLCQRRTARYRRAARIARRRAVRRAWQAGDRAADAPGLSAGAFRCARDAADGARLPAGVSGFTRPVAKRSCLSAGAARSARCARVA